MDDLKKKSVKDVLYPFTAWKNIFREPVTIRHPEKVEGSERYRGLFACFKRQVCRPVRPQMIQKLGLGGMHAIQNALFGIPIGELIG
ncbi:MAG: hypothetical protein PQJ58_07655, partial [Spirochaetales bacterium]|nr:hypothetical protein [Spirochaetales bacterium]